MAISVLEVHTLLQGGLFSVHKFQYPSFLTYTSLNDSPVTAEGFLQKNMKLSEMKPFFGSCLQDSGKDLWPKLPMSMGNETGSFILHTISSTVLET